MATDHDQEEGDATSFLPNDIVHDILLRLPVKSLLKFRSVCKSWNATITNTKFIQMHHLQQYSDTHNNNNLFLHVSANPTNNHQPDVFSLVTVHEGLKKFQLESKLERPNVWKTVLCTCQGLVLLTDCSYDKYMLWNPSTRKHAMFRSPYRSDGRQPVKHGLCYDPETDDFKVVVAFEKYYAVYSCKKKSWTRRMDFGYGSCIVLWYTNIGIFVDGVIYSLVFDKRRKRKEIIYFDPRDDGFKTLEKPENMKGLLKYKTYSLVCLRGCLCLYFRTTSLNKRTAFRIWIKEKGIDNNCWSELMIVENFEKPRGVYWITPVYLFENNKILIHITDRRFVIYSPFEKTFENIEDIDPLIGFKLVPCPESLLFPLENMTRKRKRRCQKIV